jgi:hypothetical protein
MSGANGGRKLARRRLLAGGAIAGVAAAGGGVAAWLGLRGSNGAASPGPTASPTVTPSPTITPIPTATPRPVTPTPVPGASLIEETSGEWLVQHFAPGEAIDLARSICFMAPGGDITCYELPAARTSNGGQMYRCSDDNRWIVVESQPASALFDRATGREFSYPTPPQGIRLLSEDYIVFSSAQEFHGQSWPPDPSGPYFVVDPEMQQVSEFEVPELEDRFPLRTWKRGPGTFAYTSDRRAIRQIDLATGEVLVLHEPEPLDRYELYPRDIQWQPGGPVLFRFECVSDRGWDELGRPNAEFPIINRIVAFEPDGTTFRSVRDWVQGPPHYSPDGKYVAVQSSLHSGPGYIGSLRDEWVLTTLYDARSGAPIFRVRSLAVNSGDFLDDNRWLVDSSGVVAVTHSPGAGAATFARDIRYQVLRTSGSRLPLPAPPDPDGEWYRNNRVAAPVPSPGNIDLLSYGRITLLDRSTGTFTAPLITDDGPTHMSPWGRSDAEEMRFALTHGGHDGGGIGVLLAPKLEYPPFDDSLRVRVAVSGTCLNLRAAPSLAAGVLDCLDAGTLLTLEPEPGESTDESPVKALGGAMAHYNWQDDQSFARVVTDGGDAGWVALQFLEWA